MRIIDILIETTWAASTSYIPLPDGQIPIAFVPTTQLLVGNDGVKVVNFRKHNTTGVQINTAGVKHNVLRLTYRAVGELVR